VRLCSAELPAEARPVCVFIPSGRTKLCLAIDKVAFSWAISISRRQIRWNSAFVPCADRIPVGRGDLVETSQLDVLWLIQTDSASLVLIFCSGLQGVVDVCLGLGSHYFVFSNVLW